MNHSIVPKLVSLKTNVINIPAFFSSNLNFFKINSSTKHIINFNFNFDSRIEIPKKFSFRHGYYTFYQDKWYYRRPLFGPVTLKMSYDPLNYSFKASTLFRLIPFEIGQLWPIGGHLGDLMMYECLKKGYIFIRGAAVNYKNKNILFMAPAFNWKTTIISLCMEKGASYIGEEYVVTDGEYVYPVSPHNPFLARNSNDKVLDILKNKNVKKVDRPLRIDEIIVLKSFSHSDYRDRTLDVKTFNGRYHLMLNYLYFRGTRYTRNLLTLALVYKNKEVEVMNRNIDKISKRLAKKSIRRIDFEKFDFEKFRI